MKTLMRSAVLALLATVVCTPNADAQISKCQRAIAKANSQFLQARVKALAKCEEGVVKSGAGTCPDDKANASIAKAESKLASAIGKSCGGDDKVCGGDMTNEFTRADLGWPTLCPNVERTSCESQIFDCADMTTCLTCIAGTVSDGTMDFLYDDLALPSTSDKTLNKCQVTIGKATTAYMNSVSKTLQKCWDARLNGKHSGDCFPPSNGDGKYVDALAKAEAKKVSSICKACGGADKACGGGDDLTPAAIGFRDECPDSTRPNGGASCAAPITDLYSIVACVDCITAFRADCADLAAVPQFAPYPTECARGCTDKSLTGACPTTITFTAEGRQVDLDTGFTGLAQDAQVPTNGRLTLAVSGCDGANHPTCGECDVTGPLDNPGGVTYNNRRCKDASWVQCTADSDCTNATACIGGSNTAALCTNNSECPGGTCGNAGYTGPCLFFFGAPLPLRAGGVSTCVVNEVVGAVSGTINLSDGTSVTQVPLSSRVHVTGTEFRPCPRCIDNVCAAGVRLGQACSVNGTGQFGDVSLDCPPPPGAFVGALSINLDIATGTQTKTLTAANPTCRQTGYTGSKCFCDSCNNVNQEGCFTNADCPLSLGEPGICGGRRCIAGSEAGKPCQQCMGGANHGANCTVASQCPGGSCPVGCAGFCSGGPNAGAVCNAASECPGGTCPLGACNRPGEATQPNSCNDDTTTVGFDCDPVLGTNEGQCTFGPFDQVCSLQTFRTCSDDGDCAPDPMDCPDCLPDQTCITRSRECFTDNGEIGASVSVAGVADVPCGDTSLPTVGSFFCVAPVGAAAVNTAGGLPALGRVLIPGVVDVNP